MYNFEYISDVKVLLLAVSSLLDDIRKSEGVLNVAGREGVSLPCLSADIEKKRLQVGELQERIDDLLSPSLDNVTK